jgi:NAD(P)-dependent dehydrogenase (short-subunit alcohol dehydrogenase family)
VSPVSAPRTGKERIALVTGAGQGVGRQVALDLVHRGIAAAAILND